MSHLTAAQLTELGNAYLSFANAVDEYRMNNWSQLSPDQNQTLKTLHSLLCRYADDLFATSAIAIGSEADAAYQTIKEVAQQIDQTYRGLQKIQKAIDIATAGVTLGSALFSGNPAAIRAAVSGLTNTLKKDS